MKIIIKGSLELAEHKKLIQDNPFSKVRVNYKLCRYISTKPSNTQVYLPEEKELFMKFLSADFEENRFITDDLAILILFQTGMRIEELAALKWSDIEGNYIHVQRTERKESEINEDLSFGTHKRFVVNHVKNKNEYGARLIYLTETCREILKKTKEISEAMHYADDDFIFCNENGRTPARAIQYRIRKICRHAGIPEKSSHKIRKTVAPELNVLGLPIDEIRRMSGHSDEKTTLGYIFNLYNEDTTNDIIEKALSH